jgi:hypothetical protein
MVIDEVDVEGIVFFKPEDQTPIPADGNAQKPFISPVRR